MRRRASENVAFLMVPAICVAVTGYFGYSGIFGERGLLALETTRARLAIATQDLADVRAKREALQRRIALLEGTTVDSDLLDELARGLLLESGPDEVAVPREKH
jgi:cell division protein FtsB